MKLRPLAALTSASALLLAMSAAPVLADSTSASVSQTQTNQVSQDGSTPRGAQTSQINGSAAAGASGNIGLNAAGGTSNVQANDLVMQSAGTGNSLSPGSSITQTLTNVGTGTGNPAQGQVSSSDTSTLGDSGASGSVPAPSPKGNFGANSAAGDSNEQINILTLSAKPVGNATQTSSQTINGNGTTSLAGAAYTSSITGTIGDGLTGNGGFNTAAGDKNLQSNSLDLFTTKGTTPGSASLNLGQTINGDNTGLGGGAYSSTIDASALSGVTGNVGANSAAGASNIQNNTALITDKTPLSSISGSFSQSATNVNSAGPPSFSSTISGGGGTGNLSENSTAGTHQLQMNVLVVGDPPVPAPVSQSITQSSTDGNATVVGGTATINTGGFSGNAQLTNSVGMQNQQMNVLTTVAGDATTVQQTITQQINGDSANGYGNYDSGVTGNTAQGASGNVGVTNAAGAQNLQANGAVLVTGAAASVTQSFNPTIGSSANGASNALVDAATLNAHVDTNTAQGASGNVGINNASGLQNVQANGLVIVSGASTPASAAGATQQMPDSGHAGPTINGASYVVSNSSLTSTIGDSAAAGAGGRVGINTAAGVQNVQNNAVSLYSGTVNGVTSGQNYTQSTTTQSGTAPASGSSLAYGSDTASIGGSAGSGATGILGFNTAAGAQNVQSNATSIFAPNAGGSANTSTQLQQTITGGNFAVGMVGTTNTSTLSGNVGQGTSGLVAANVAAGAGNQQASLSTVLDDSNASGTLGANLGPAIQAGQTQNNLSLNSDATDTNSASMTDAFGGANGVVSANNAAGGYNQQANVFLVSTGNLGNISPTTPQQSNGATLSTPSVPNTSTIGGNAFQNAGGAIGANNAAGLTNQQANNVVVQH